MAVLVDALSAVGIDYISGVPDSALIPFIVELNDHPNIVHQIAACEGSAVAMAAGRSMASKQPSGVYMQNSGLPNALNPLVSMFSPIVYDIPLTLIVGWRGEPGTKDEPQHMVMGRITESMLDLLGIDPLIVDARTAQDRVRRHILESHQKRRHAALLVRRSAFVAPRETAAETAPCISNFEESVDRVVAVTAILESIREGSVVFSSTGYTAREVMLFESERGGERRFTHIPCVGGMGFASSFAAGASGADGSRDVYCIDGDGAFLMHGISNAVIPGQGGRFKHIVLNNGCHNSVGGFPTCSASADLAKIAEGMGYAWCKRVTNERYLKSALEEVASHTVPAFFEIRCGLQSFGKLPRPDRPLSDYKNDFLATVGVRDHRDTVP
ncbi:phosphonopyruvate decarboxylase [Mesorhizobium escarrei]|uniref:Phosphonopyruvate decarboxylase n=1 Tax=Mesorhizobium escarrei TaxID=666018 RepID=A0ABM9E050_9HYPH|nr:phosphonopyruvate decarboxylase [Mesorhizobium escarrei]CAH2402334.1 Phosphonopyruvate decarboxylase [Mesorhizobium escarrei]